MNCMVHVIPEEDNDDNENSFNNHYYLHFYYPNTHDVIEGIHVDDHF